MAACHARSAMLRRSSPRWPAVWRVSLSWQGTLLDTVTVRRRGRLALRTGERWRVDVDDDALVLRPERSAPADAAGLRLRAGATAALPEGHSLLVERDVGAPALPLELAVDSTFLHATMVGVAATICMFSAFWFAPVEQLADAGAGLPSNARRWLTLPGGAARAPGRPVFAANGRLPEEAERLSTARQRGAPVPRRGRGASLQQTLEAM